MSLVESRMMPLGSPAPDFTLPDPDGLSHSLGDAAQAGAVVIAFICNHCPYVKHIATALAGVSDELIAEGAAVFAINSNDSRAYPDDSPERMAEEVERRGYRFPYLVDADQSVAKAYGAVSLRTSSYSTVNAAWPTAGSSTRAGRTGVARPPVRISPRR